MPPIDYSKWDNLELSDDEDIEVHPNIDKRSFIRWRQQQIHQEREERRQKINQLQQEQTMNKELIGRLHDIIRKCKEGGASAVFANLLSEAKKASTEAGRPSYEQMLAVLLEQIQEKEIPGGNNDAWLDALTTHLDKLTARQQECLKELATLEETESKKLTVDKLCRPGFDSTIVNKASSSAKRTSGEKKKHTEKHIEVLNPESVQNPESVPAAAEQADDNKEDKDDLDVSEPARQFAKCSTLEDSFQFISRNPEILHPLKSDELLALAFEQEYAKQEKEASHSVHQALILQYTQHLGKDGVSLFFARLTDQKHRARTMFYQDVQSTYNRIHERCKVLHEESKEAEVEKIQLQATGPDTRLEVDVPSPEDTERYNTFQSFPLEFRQALQEGTITEVNKALENIKPDVAESLLNLCTEHQILKIHGIYTEGEEIPE